MKKGKTFLAILLCATVAFAALVLASCTPAVITVEVKAGTYPDTVDFGEDVDFTGLVVIGTRANKKKIEVEYPNSSLEVGHLDTTSAGLKTVTVKYTDSKSGTLQTQFSVVVKEYDEPEVPVADGIILTYGKPQNLVDYETVKGNANEFIDHTAPYTVGTDNKVVFNTRVTVYDNATNGVSTPANFLHDIKVELKSGSSYQPVGNEYFTVTDKKGEIKFDAAAAGKTFKITFSPDASMFQTYASGNYSWSFELSVESGWNVYNLDDLSRFDNTKSPDSRWNTYKNNRVEPHIKGMFLQNDITLRKSELPENFFTAPDRAVLNSWVGIFIHYTPENETFNFDGNYFNVSAAEIPLFNDAVNSHSTLFVFGNGEEIVSGVVDDTLIHGTNIIKNFSLFGNSGRTGSDGVLKRGGLTAINASSKETIVENCNVRAFDTAFNFGVTIKDGIDKTSYANTVRNAKVSDMYSTALFIWGNKVTVENSDFHNTGAPVSIIAQTDDSGLYEARLTVDANTYFATAVTGEEPWFVEAGAQSISLLLSALDVDIKTATGKSLKKDGLYNIISVLYHHNVINLPYGEIDIAGITFDLSVPHNISNNVFGGQKPVIVASGSEWVAYGADNKPVASSRGIGSQQVAEAFSAIVSGNSAATIYFPFSSNNYAGAIIALN